MRLLDRFEHATGSVGSVSTQMWLFAYLPYVGIQVSFWEPSATGNWSAMKRTDVAVQSLLYFFESSIFGR